VSGVADVAFGAGGKFYFKDGVSGSIACTDAVFGDPDYGVVKSCYTIPA
jgi:alpha-L-rhamnosidase